MEGQRIGNYTVVRKIGQGGMGAVYEAVHEQLGRKVAIKLLRAELSEDPHIAKRFLNEGRAASRVDHSGIVQIFEFGNLPDGTAYIVMELLRGEPLSARLRSHGGRLPVADVLRIGRQIASALAAAHQIGIVHRDLKPDNVMIVPDSEMPGGERIKLLDFGVAKLVTQYEGQGAEELKTNTGMVLGTASYMAPEQCKGAGQVTDKADVYSLGIVLYRMLCSQLPFRAEGQGEIMAMHIFTTARPLRELDTNIPQEVADLVAKMMRKEAGERPTMQEVASELERMSMLPGIGPRAQPVFVMVSGSRNSGNFNSQSATIETLAHGVGQSGGLPAVRRPPRRARWLLPVFGALLVLIAGGASAVTLLLHRGRLAFHFPVAAPAAPATAGSSSLAAPSTSLATPSTQPAPPAPTPAPAPGMIHWHITSTPDQAEVINKSDNQRLGNTPWDLEQASFPGALGIILRAPGHQEREVLLDGTKDFSQHFALEPLLPPGVIPAEGSPPPPTKPQTRRSHARSTPSGKELTDEDIDIIK